MKKQITRVLSVMIIVALLVTTIIPGTVRAKENEDMNSNVAEDIDGFTNTDEDTIVEDSTLDEEKAVDNNKDEQLENVNKINGVTEDGSKQESNRSNIEKGTSNKVETEEDEYYAEKNNLANSWRYTDGEVISSRARAGQYTTWPKVEGAVAYGIDVSYHNGKIDWVKAKAAGVDYAIVRCGYGMDVKGQDDIQWEANADACEKYGIPYGTYIYSYATDVTRAKSEAEHVLRLVKGRDLDYPIYFDMEDETVVGLSAKTKGDIAEAFCETIEEAGYEVAIYANKNWFTNYLTDSRFDQWDKWVAQYNTECTYEGEYTMWQCSSEGQVDGIKGNVDLNIDFKDKWVEYNPDRYGDVKNSTVLRSAPKTGEELATIPEGERVLLKGYEKFSDTSWYKTSYEGEIGYVLSTDLKLSYQEYDPVKQGRTTANMYMRSGVGLNYTKKVYIKSGSSITLHGYYRTEGYDW